MPLFAGWPRRRLAARVLCLSAGAVAIAVFNCVAVVLPAQNPPSVPSALSQSSYVLKAGDDLEIAFFYNPELNQHALIRPDGRISMPLLGELQAEGMTVKGLTDTLQTAYEPQLKRASLNIQVRSLPNQVIFVGGEVEHPGVFALRGTSPTALQALIEAGGMKESAVHGGVTVLRKGTAGAVEMHTLSFRHRKGEVADGASFPLQPLDVLIVSESRISKIDRVMDQYVKRLSPVLLTGGFTYLFGNANGTPF